MSTSPHLVCGFLLCLAMAVPLRAQNPGAQQDAEAAREKLLKAADQIDNIQANSESQRVAISGMKDEIAKLQADNEALKQQLADLHTALDQAEAAHAKEEKAERKALLDSVADMILQSSKGNGPAKPVPKKKDKTPDPLTPPPDAGASTTTPATGTGPVADHGGTTPAPADPPTDAKPQKGYYHVVAGGETLTQICNAYRQNGVNVSITDVEKANGLTDKSVLKIGQKLFIPKPGT